MDMNLDMLKQLPQLTQSMLESSGFLMNSSFLVNHQQPNFPPRSMLIDNCFSRTLLQNHDIVSPVPVPSFHSVLSNQDVAPEINKRKTHEQSNSCSKSISPATSGTNTKKFRRCRKEKNREAGEDKAEEVVHVRAKRGQATDSHSIAERVRRERINSKLRCLQDIVPGCNKSMGMAVMLDEIINYVHSLQNQVEFLSMELAAASHYYGIMNPETGPLKKAHQGTNSPEAQEMQKLTRGAYGDPNWFHTTWSI